MSVSAYLAPQPVEFHSRSDDHWEMDIQPIPLTKLFLLHESEDNEHKERARKRYPRPPHYNSNEARARQRREIVALRQTTKELEAKLHELHTERRMYGKSETPGVWEEIALLQRNERRRAEEENKRLKGEVQRQEEIATCLQRVVQLSATVTATRGPSVSI